MHGTRQDAPSARGPFARKWRAPDDRPNHHQMNPTHRLLAALTVCAALTSTALAADAAANWENQCAKCHGPDGKGDTKMGKKLAIADLTDAKVQAKFTDEIGRAHV